MRPILKTALQNDTTLRVVISAEALQSEAEEPRHQLEILPQVIGTEQLVSLQPYGSTSPVFVFHGNDGTVQSLRPFAAHFAYERPVYGLQSPVLLKRMALMPKLDQLVGQYIESIRTVSPEGSYTLVGWGNGGVVAFETARQLQRQGVGIEKLILIDSCNPLVYEQPHHFDEARLLASFVRDVAGHAGFTSEMDADTLRALTSQRDRLECAYRTIMQLTGPKLTLETFQTNYLHFKQVSQLCLKYWPKPVEGKITLVKSINPSAEAVTDPHLGWSVFANEGIDLLEFEADHFDLMCDGYISPLIKKLGY